MKSKDIVYIALFCSIIAALGTVPPLLFPLNPVPITAQSLGVMLCGSLVGAKRGALACVLFLGLMAIGFPVLAGGKGGLSVLFGPSGGFLLSWPIAAYVIGALFERNWQSVNSVRAFLFITTGGIGVLYTLGILWLVAVSGLPFNKAIYGAIIFIPGDIVKAVIATMVSVTVKRSYPLMSPTVTE